LREAVAITRTADGHKAAQAHELLAFSYQAAASVPTKLGEADLAWTAAERGLAAAQNTGNLVVIGPTGRAGYTFGLVADALAGDKPGGQPPPALQAVCGSLLEASITEELKDASRSLAVDWTDMESFSRPPPGKGGHSADPQASWGHRKNNLLRSENGPHRNVIPLGAAYRNRTDDLRITRRIRAVHGCPGGHTRPGRRGSCSRLIQADPGLLLADALALSARRSGRLARRDGRPPGRTLVACAAERSPHLPEQRHGSGGGWPPAALAGLATWQFGVWSAYGPQLRDGLTKYAQVVNHCF
jgi:hypothetical protein